VVSPKVLASNDTHRCRRPRLSTTAAQLRRSVTTAWCALALARGKAHRFEPDTAPLAAAREWFGKMTNENTGVVGRYRDDDPAFTSALLVRALGGEEFKGRGVRAAVNKLINAAPKWEEREGAIDLQFWYFGFLALSKLDANTAAIWRPALVEACIAGQSQDDEAEAGRGRHRDVGRAGSWGSSADRGGAQGGRLYATALCILMLEAADNRGLAAEPKPMDDKKEHGKPDNEKRDEKKDDKKDDKKEHGRGR
jgi:hypothetical protein